MQSEIDPKLVVFESLTGTGGSRVFYAGALIEGLTLEVRLRSSREEINEAQDQVVDFVERCLAAMPPEERGAFLARLDRGDDFAERLSFGAFLDRLRAMKRRIEVSQLIGEVPAMTAAEHEILATLGIEEETESLFPLGEVLAIQEMLVATSVPLAEAATIIGAEPAKLRQRLEEGYMLGVWLAGHNWRVLAFQLTENGALPGLDMVLEKIPMDINPVGIWAFFTTPQPRLLQHGRMLEPVAWLASGGDPEIVSDLAGSL
ncbi:hypothetical protein [Limimaricola soesokkakensis]|uniref:hypothetical protein n=1 Tax=Limimaricola soesokkakensis TaxID=1343159 RepID=UPI00351221A0